MVINKNLIYGLILCAVSAFAGSAALAQTDSGTVAVTATTVGSVNLTFVTDAAGITLGGSGTSAASIAFGSVQAKGGTVPTGVTKTLNGATSWTLSTPFDVVVTLSNSASTAYTLNVSLNTADAINTWALNATVLTATPAALTATGTFGSTPYTLNLTIPNSATAGAISNTINFTVIAA